MDVALLSRIQFAVTIGFHFLFPPITIGLAWLLLIVETLSLTTAKPVYDHIARLFARLLGLTFAMGVATGIVMEFQFGANWAAYSKYVGDIFGAPLAAEAISAFFLESVFLALYLFARNRIPKPWHWFSILMVAIGSTLSAFWIIVANSWMQTPAGFEIRNGRAELTSFAAAVFNPSTIVRFNHTLAASLATGAFFMAGAAAYLLLRNSRKNHPSDPLVITLAHKTLKISLIFALLTSILTAFPFGDQHARQLARTQPEKFAAIEGIYHSQTNAPLLIFAIPLTNPPRLLAPIGIPGLASRMAFDDPNALIQGIDAFPPDRIPPLFLTFVSFHNMVAIGLLLIALSAVAVSFLRRDALFTKRWLLWLLVVSVPLPLAACQLGWIVAEVGRQPWIVYHQMLTASAFSTVLTPAHVLFSLILFSALYLLLLALYLFVLFHKLHHPNLPTPVP